MSVKSDLYLDKWSQYAKKEVDWINEGPKYIFDTAKRVRRETVRGKTTVFHESIEDYLVRQFRAYTVPRVGIHLLLFSIMTWKYYTTLRDMFSNSWKYKSFSANPVYKKLGFSYTFLYVLRPIFMGYLTLRVSKLFYETCKKQWNGEHDFVHQVVQEEWTYDTWFKDARDFRMVNFRYSDHLDPRGQWSAYNPDVFKADADYYKQIFKFFKKGDDNLLEYFTHWKKH